MQLRVIFVEKYLEITQMMMQLQYLITQLKKLQLSLKKVLKVKDFMQEEMQQKLTGHQLNMIAKEKL